MQNPTERAQPDHDRLATCPKTYKISTSTTSVTTNKTINLIEIRIGLWFFCVDRWCAVKWFKNARCDNRARVRTVLHYAKHALLNWIGPRFRRCVLPGSKRRIFFQSINERFQQKPVCAIFQAIKSGFAFHVNFFYYYFPEQQLMALHIRYGVSTDRRP